MKNTVSMRAMLMIGFLILVLSGVVAFANVYLNRPTQVTSKAAGIGQIPPTSSRSQPPAGAFLPTAGIGLTNSQYMTGGNFQVEGYCPARNMGSVSRDNTDWYCGSYKLQVTDFDRICSMTYAQQPIVFAIRNGTTSTPAFNWRCYALAPVSPTPTTTPSPTPTPLITPTPTPISSATPTPNVGFALSDLNKNHRADPDDYRIFLEDYRRELAK